MKTTFMSKLVLLLIAGACPALAQDIDFAISVPRDLSALPDLSPTREQAAQIERSLKRIESCQTLQGVRASKELAYESGCIRANYHIFVAVLATSVRVYSAYADEFPTALEACDSFNHRSGRGHDESRMYWNGAAKVYGLEKACVDKLMTEVRRNVEKVYLSRVRE